AVGASDEVAAANASYYLAVALAASHDGPHAAAELLRSCLPILESAGDLEAAALGYCLQGRHASADQRHGAAMRLARSAMSLAAGLPDAGLVQCAALSLLGLPLARIGACASAARHCDQARSAARSLGEPVYEAHADMSLAQVLILSGETERAADVCLEGISLAREYRSLIDVARFG